MKKEWYKDWFSSKYYPELYRHRDDNEAKYLIDLVQRNSNLISNLKVLDVCCGAGRHSIELARRGYNVTGFDLSDYLINKGKDTLRKIPERNLKIKFLKKDMRKFNFRNSFNIALNVFSSFGYFDSDEENFLVFKNVYNSLVKKGLFVFDFLNERYIRKKLVAVSNSYINRKIITQKRRIENDFVIKDIYIGKSIFTEKLKLYKLPEIISELKKTGFKIDSVFGDYFGNKFEVNKSNRFVIFSKRN